MIRLAIRGLLYYWRTHTAVIAGVAAAVTVLSGALLVGDSVRGSLRDLVLRRIGATDLAVLSNNFFNERLADDVRADPEFGDTFTGTAPIISTTGLVSEQTTGRRASRVQVYGVDDRFWQFHSLEPRALGPRDVLLSEALASAIGAEPGSAVLVRVQQPSAAPLESLHGRRENLGRTMRLTASAILGPADLGEFSLMPQQGDVLAAFVSLDSLQEDLDLQGRVNAALVSVLPAAENAPAALESLVRQHTSIEDTGLSLRMLDAQGVLALEAPGGLIDDRRAYVAIEAATPLGLEFQPVLTYLVNTIRFGNREVPYSLVTATDIEEVASPAEYEDGAAMPLVINDWLAKELGAEVGDPLTLDYYFWEDPGRLVTEQATVVVSKVIPLRGAAADRDFAPAYAGITTSENLQDWDPPFPIDLSRIRAVDEQYWDQYRTTPKAFMPMGAGATLWRSRYGAMTSIRFMPPPGVSIYDAEQQFRSALRDRIDPLELGLTIRNVRTDSLAASRGATNFGEYFTYFSFFLVVSALVLAALFFRLGIEQRGREVGLLRAAGFTPSAIRSLFGVEALILALIGSAIGTIGALGYGELMMTGLRTFWVDAVGTRSLTLHISTSSLVLGAAGGVVAALGCIWWTLRSLARVSERSLLAGAVSADPFGEASHAESGSVIHDRRAPSRIALAGACLAIGLLLILLATIGRIGETGAFFGGGALLLTAALVALSEWLRRRPASLISGRGWFPLARLGMRSASYRPARSVLSVAVVASATFILIAVDAFRRDGAVDSQDVHSGTGGYEIIVNTMLPFVHDPDGEEGRRLLGLSSETNVSLTPFRVLPGDDASCLNLYEPRQPRIVAAPDRFLNEGRFAFSDSLASTEAERANPWLLLHSHPEAGVVPVIADANSMTYVLHKQLGDDIVVDLGGSEPVRLRLVAALADSFLQGELVMSDSQFRRLFPDREGYEMLLVDTPPERAQAVADELEASLTDLGGDAVRGADRLAEFHRVENTYLATFQSLGGLGLLLGTVGLAAVMARNILERRRELALLGAVGFSRGRLILMAAAESGFLLLCGLASGAIGALIAIAPAALDRGAIMPSGAGLWILLFAVFATGLLSTLIGTRLAIRSRLLDALRSE